MMASISDITLKLERKREELVGNSGTFPFLSGLPTLPGFFRRSTYLYLLQTLRLSAVLSVSSAILQLGLALGSHSKSFSLSFSFFFSFFFSSFHSASNLYIKNSVLKSKLQALIYLSPITLSLVDKNLRANLSPAIYSLHMTGKRLRFFLIQQNLLFEKWLTGVAPIFEGRDTLHLDFSLVALFLETSIYLLRFSFLSASSR